MKKNLIISLILITLLSVLSFLFAGTEEYQLEINGEKIEFSNKPMRHGTEIMLPINEVFEYFGALPKWRDDNKMMTCLYNNTYCKLHIGNLSVFINGVKEKLEQAPIISGETAYAPISFFSDFFSLDFNQTDNSIYLKNRNNKVFMLFGQNPFAEKELGDTKIKIALPEGWLNISESDIGVTNPYETYSFEIDTYSTKDGFNTEAYIAELMSNLQKGGDSKKYVSGEIENSYYNTDDYVFGTVNYSMREREEKDENTENKEIGTKSDITSTHNSGHRLPERKKPVYHSHYILEKNGNIYDFHFKHNKFNPKSKVVKDFENSLRTLKFEPDMTSSHYEHYYETDSFHNLGFKLNQPIYSNMEIKDNLLIEGSIKDSSIKELVVKVTKQEFIYEYPIEINDKGEFSSLVYSPFGVGKHNFTVYALIAGQREEIMKFSALNISGTDIAYTIPSEKIISNSTQTRDLLNSILDKADKNRSYSSDYSIAATIYEYVKEIIKTAGIDSNLERELAFDEINTDYTISENEANILFCTLMRAAGIPCRVLRGENKEITRIFSSCYINGNWYAYDIVADNYKIKNDITMLDKHSVVPEYKFSTTKHLLLENYSEIYEKISELRY